jgi:hypothetical protein
MHVFLLRQQSVAPSSDSLKSLLSFGLADIWSSDASTITDVDIDQIFRNTSFKTGQPDSGQPEEDMTSSSSSSSSSSFAQSEIFSENMDVETDSSSSSSAAAAADTATSDDSAVSSLKR